MSSRAASGALNDLLTDDEEGYSLVERQAESPTSTSAAGEAAAIDSLADAANAAASALIGNEECSVEAKKEEESPSCFPGAAHAPTRVSVDLAPSAGEPVIGYYGMSVLGCLGAWQHDAASTAARRAALRLFTARGVAHPPFYCDAPCLNLQSHPLRMQARP